MADQRLADVRNHPTCGCTAVTFPTVAHSEKRSRDRGIDCNWVFRCHGYFVTDHWVAVLRVLDGMVELGDPISGKRTVSATDFMRVWRHESLLVTRSTVVLNGVKRVSNGGP